MVLNELNQSFYKRSSFNSCCIFLSLILLHNYVSLIQLSLLLLKISVPENFGSFIYTMSFLLIQLLNGLLYPFHLTYNLSPFLLVTFSIKLFLICFLQFVFVERSNNFFFNKIINNICPRHRIFNFFNHKHLFRRIWSNFDILTLYPILNFGFLSLISLVESTYVFDFTSKRFILIVLWHELLYLLTILYNLSV